MSFLILILWTYSELLFWRKKNWGGNVGSSAKNVTTKNYPKPSENFATSSNHLHLSFRAKFSQLSPTKNFPHDLWMFLWWSRARKKWKKETFRQPNYQENMINYLSEIKQTRWGKICERKSLRKTMKSVNNFRESFASPHKNEQKVFEVMSWLCE